MKNTFLTAEWKNLIIANYEIDANILKPYLPNNTTLDLWKGKCYISLVAFIFKNTKIKACKIPFHKHFEEVNLRFYVKHKTKNGETRRGVVFIKEIVPKPLITFVANTLYKEHYQTMKMKHSTIEEVENIRVNYKVLFQNNWNKIEVKAENIETEIEENSFSEFITEHYWGYTKLNNTKTYEYEVEHPRWKNYPIWDYNIDLDFKKRYGNDFEQLSNNKPYSVILAVGSTISVGNKTRI